MDTLQWNTDEAEMFNFVYHNFDVTLAKKILRDKPREIKDMNIEGVMGLVGEPGKLIIGVGINWDKALSDEVDLTFPIILVHYEDSFMPIDGWHRIGKAKMQGIMNLPCVVLDREESAKVSDLYKPKKSVQVTKPKRKSRARKANV